MTVIKDFPVPNASGNENVTKLGITSISESESIIYADCLADDESVISPNNWFWYKGTNKNVPFTLTKAEIDKIKSTE